MYCVIVTQFHTKTTIAWFIFRWQTEGPIALKMQTSYTNIQSVHWKFSTQFLTGNDFSLGYPHYCPHVNTCIVLFNHSVPFRGIQQSAWELSMKTLIGIIQSLNRKVKTWRNEEKKLDEEKKLKLIHYREIQQRGHETNESSS